MFSVTAGVLEAEWELEEAEGQIGRHKHCGAINGTEWGVPPVCATHSHACILDLELLFHWNTTTNLHVLLFNLAPGLLTCFRPTFAAKWTKRQMMLKLIWPGSRYHCRCFSFSHQWIHLLWCVSNLMMFQSPVEKPAVFYCGGKSGSVFRWQAVIIKWRIFWSSPSAVPFFFFPLFVLMFSFLEIKKTEMSRRMINTAVVQEDMTAAFPQEQAGKSLTTSLGIFRGENNTVNAVKKKHRERQILLPRKRETSIKVLGQSAPSLAVLLRINVCSHKIYIKSFSVHKIVL